MTTSPSPTPLRPCRTAGLVLSLLAAALAPGPPVLAQDADTEDVQVVHEGKPTKRSAIEGQLSAAVREALDQWAEAAGRLELDVVVGQTAEHVVLGGARTETLIEASRHLDQAYSLLDPLVPVTAGRSRRATVAILVDEKFVRSPAWAALLAELQERKLLVEQAVTYLAREPEGVTMRQTPLFLQPTYDLTGEGEFRLPNEVTHKFAQCLLTSRAGQQPAQILWGLGYVVEQRLFDSSYHFRLREFVYSSSHFDWRREARKELDARRKAKDFSLAPLLLDEETAGRPEGKQLVSWAALAWLARHDGAALSSLLAELASIQAEADPLGVAPTFTGDAERAREAVARSMEVIEPAKLSQWLGQKDAPKSDK